MGGTEDQRSAATIYASLSSYVMTASLGVIAAQAALATFVLDKRDHLTLFYVVLVAGLIANVLSVMLGGKGIARIASSGFGGTWSLKPDGDSFNKQAAFCLLGMVLLLLSVFCGRPKSDNLYADQIQRLNLIIAQQQTQIEDLKGKYLNLTQQLENLSRSTPHQGRPAAKNR